MAYAFNSTHPNLNRAVNELNRRIFGSSANSIINTVGSLVNGSGSVAANASIESAIQWGLSQVGKITYSRRTSGATARQIWNTTNPKYLDCSAFVLTALLAGGIDLRDTGAVDCDSMYRLLRNNSHFKWIPSTSGRLLPASMLQRGDIMLCGTFTASASNHTQFYIGNNEDLSCGTSGVNRFGHIENYSYNAARGWDGALRYIG